jgi:CheY-like chemotaxis protein
MGEGKVLVIEDEEMIRDVLGGMLSRLGYEVDFASDGSQAIEKFVRAKETNQPFSAVILDLTIPGGMGGKEAVKELLKIDPQVKAIVSSGYSNDPIMADFQKYGFVKVIAKPYKISELGKVLNNAITGKE